MAVSVGVVHRALPGETLCGDQYVLLTDDAGFLAAVIDGLGHGEEAHLAACRAVAHVRANADQAPARLLAGCHEALRATRGAAMAIVRVDRQAGTLTHVALGNVETRIATAEKVLHPIPVYGIVGAQARKLRAEVLPWSPGNLLVMHTDGLDDRFGLSPIARHREPQGLANALIASHGRDTDDQLVLVVKDAP